MNMAPMMIPIVFSDAVSNCRITSAMTTHSTPKTSQSHQ